MENNVKSKQSSLSQKRTAPYIIYGASLIYLCIAIFSLKTVRQMIFICFGFILFSLILGEGLERLADKINVLTNKLEKRHRMQNK